MRELLSIPAAARRVGRDRSTVRRWHRQGRVFTAGLDVDGRELIDLVEVRRVADATPRRRPRSSGPVGVPGDTQGIPVDRGGQA